MGRRRKNARKNVIFGNPETAPENLPEIPASQSSEEVSESIPDIPTVEDIPQGFPARSFETGDLDRISFKVVEGKIDIDSVREAKAEGVKKVLQASIADEKFQQWSGIVPPKTSSPANFTPLVMGSAFDMVSYIQAGLYAKKFGVSPAELLPLLTMTELEHAQIDGIAAQCANKYLPPTMANWSDLAICGFTLVGIYRAKAQAVEIFVKTKFDRQLDAPSHDEPKSKKNSKEEKGKIAEVSPTPEVSNGQYGETHRRRSLG